MSGSRGTTADPIPVLSTVVVPRSVVTDHRSGHSARWMVLDGHRPPAQPRRIVDPSPLAYLRAVAGQLGAGRRPRSRLGTVRVCQPHEGAAEVAAVCRVVARVRAVAMRLGGGRCRPGVALSGDPPDPVRRPRREAVESFDVLPWLLSEHPPVVPAELRGDRRRDLHRPARQSVVARHEREHERAVAPLLSEEDRPARLRR
jgi:hypothetical protein